jgi:hypothetical protein
LKTALSIQILSNLIHTHYSKSYYIRLIAITMSVNI